jgi:hypothetical protein
MIYMHRANIGRGWGLKAPAWKGSSYRMDRGIRWVSNVNFRAILANLF